MMNSKIAIVTNDRHGFMVKFNKPGKLSYDKHSSLRSQKIWGSLISCCVQFCKGVVQGWEC